MTTEANPTPESAPAESTPVELTEEVIDSADDATFEALFEQAANEPEPTEGKDPAPVPSDQDRTPEDPAELSGAGEGDPQEKAPEPEADNRQVPLAALHEERAKRKEAIAEKQRMEERFTQIMDKLASRVGPDPEQAPKAPELPSLDENPVEHFDKRLAQMEAAAQQQREAEAQNAQRAQQEQQWNQVLNAYTQDVARFAQTEEAFHEAYDFWGNSRMAELQAGGATPQQATHILQQEEAAAVVRALQEGASPAERVYAIAKARGYQPKPAASPAAGPDLEVIAKGQEHSGRMPAGGNAPAEVSLESLAAMDDDAFEANWDTVIKQMR